MKRLVTAFAFSIAASSAHAVTRYDIAGMSCSEVQAIVERDGSAILRYPSERLLSLPLYDVYVRSQEFCEREEILRRTGVPTADTRYCPVMKCVESQIFVAR